MENKIYIKPLLEVISFKKDDVIVTSGFGNEYDDNFDKWTLGSDDDFWK